MSPGWYKRIYILLRLGDNGAIESCLRGRDLKICVYISLVGSTEGALDRRRIFQLYDMSVLFMITIPSQSSQ